MFLGLSRPGYATHNRAGYISYTWVSGYTYNFSITTYTNILTSTVDNCQLELYFGDGDSAVASRVNGPYVDTLCAPVATQGVPLNIKTKWNIYTCSHTFNGPGSYWITMGNPNRNYFVDNIPNSGATQFFIRSLLIINPALGAGHFNSPVLLNPPIDNGCLGQCFYYNPAAYSPDGDSLSYTLVPCLEPNGSGNPGENIPGWTLPPTTSTISLNPYNGDFVWCEVAPPPPSDPNIPFHAPPLVSEYNIAMVVDEWSQGYMVGEVELDMQIDIYKCKNTPPVILPLNDTCVEAGTKLTFPVTAYDPNHNNIQLSAVGGALSVFVKDSATFPTVGYIPNTATSTFNWNTRCSHIREQPYLVTFKAINDDAIDDPEIPLSIYKSINIQVIAPPVQNVLAKASGSTMHITWSATACPENLIGYLIYRKDSCSLWKPAPCQNGIPPSSGFSYIGTTASTSFIDTNNGNGLVRGVNYAYLVVAVYADGSVSYASAESCAELVRDVPIITNVDVISTASSGGHLRVKWIKPLADSSNLDTSRLRGPYQYVLLRDSGFASPSQTVYTFNSPYFASLALDTTFLDTLCNTAGTPYTYRINFYSNADSNLVGSTDNASSVYLSIAPAPVGNKLNLSWNYNVPWNNYQFVIYKLNPKTSVYDSIGFTSLQTYSDTSRSDTNALVNGHSYCYLVKSIGAYSDSSLPKPLINHSEIQCAVPKDIIPPCAPVLTVVPNCDNYSDSLVWTDPDHMNCGLRDVVGYRVYFTPVEGQPYQKIWDTKNSTPFSLYHSNDTIKSEDSLSSIAGCYVVTAIDSSGNESAYSNQVCVDNCPVYSLPNVFTPNGDGENDYFKPFPYKFVKDIDLEIYDRWGLLVFKTSDPGIHWDGVNMYSKIPVTDGTYYYICVVNEIHYEGIIPRTLHGFVQIIQSKGDPAAH